MAGADEQLIVLLEARVDAFEKAFQRANKTSSDSWDAIEGRAKRGATGLQAGARASAAAAAAQGSAWGAASRGHDAHSAAVKINSMQMMELTHVAKSLFDQLAAGQSVTRALTVEGGRLAQIFSQGGVGGTLAGMSMRLVQFATSAAGVGVAIAAIPIAGGAAWLSWRNQQDALANSLEGVGKRAGITVDQLTKAAEAGAAAAGITPGAGRGMAEQLARTGSVPGDLFAGIIGSSRKYAALTGQDFDKASDELVKAFAKPQQGADTLNEHLGFLDGSTRHLIDTLVASGDTLGATRALFDAYSKSVGDAAEHTNAFVTGWEKVKGFIGGAISGTGAAVERAVAPTLEQQLSDAKGIRDRATMPEIARDEEARIADLERQIRERDAKSADDTAKSNAAQKSLTIQGALPGLLPDVYQHEALGNQLSNLRDAMSLPGVEKALGDQAVPARQAIEALSNKFSSFKMSADQVREASDFATKSALTRSDADRAALSAQQKFTDEMRNSGREVLATAKAEAERNLALANAQRALKDYERSVSDQASMFGLRPAQRRQREIDIRARDFNDNNLPSGSARAPMSILEGQIGKNASDVQPFLGAGGQSLAAKFYAWCAAAMNSALEQAGIHGSGSNMARSLLNVGSPVTDPQHGDIVILRRGSDGVSGHTGFFDKFNDDGSVRVLGGNTGGRVGYGNFDPSKVLGYRRVGNYEGIRSGAAKTTADAHAAQSQEDLYGVDSPFGRAKDDLAEQSAALRLQKEALGQTTEQAAAAAEKQRLLNEYWRDGTDLTPDLLKDIDALSQQYGQNAKASEQLTNGMKALDDARSGIRDSIGGFATDMLHGASAATALHDALSKLADRALNSALDGLFNSVLGKQGSTGGILGGWLGSFFGVGGGVPGAVSAVGASASIGVWDSGGYTGSGTKYQPAGIVHKGEYVFDQAATQRIGVRNLDVLHRGYAAGGFVGDALPSIPVVTGSAANGGPKTMHVDNSQVIHIDAKGAEIGVEQKIASMIIATNAERDRTLGHRYAEWHENN